MSKINKLIRAAVESVDAAAIQNEEAFVDHELQPVTAPTLEEGDSIFSQEEGYVLAAEALHAQARSLETLLSALHKVPESAATPEVIEAIQATIVLPDEPAIATEFDKSGTADVTDVEEKTASADSIWQKTKGHAEKSAKTMAAAVKEVLKTIMQFLENVWDWIVTSRRSIQKQLEEQKSKIGSGPQSTNVTLNRHMKALTHGDAFGPQQAKSSLNRYAEVLAACAYAIQNVLVFTGSFKTVSFKPDALQNFSTHFVERTKDALHWSDENGAQTAQVFEGEGGVNVSVTIPTRIFGSVTIHQEAQGGDAATTENAFSRSDMVDINRRGLTLLKGVAACEPEIKKVQNSLRGLMAIDLTAGIELMGKHPTVIWLTMRSYLNFANRIGVGMAVRGAGAAAALGKAYLAGNAAPADAAADSGNAGHGEIVQKQLGHSAA